MERMECERYRVSGDAIRKLGFHVSGLESPKPRHVRAPKRTLSHRGVKFLFHRVHTCLTSSVSVSDDAKASVPEFPTWSTEQWAVFDEVCKHQRELARLSLTEKSSIISDLVEGKRVSPISWICMVLACFALNPSEFASSDTADTESLSKKMFDFVIGSEEFFAPQPVGPLVLLSNILYQERRSSTFFFKTDDPKVRRCIGVLASFLSSDDYLTVKHSLIFFGNLVYNMESCDFETVIWRAITSVSTDGTVRSLINKFVLSDKSLPSTESDSLAAYACTLLGNVYFKMSNSSRLAFGDENDPLSLVDLVMDQVLLSTKSRSRLNKHRVGSAFHALSNFVYRNNERFRALCRVLSVSKLTTVLMFFFRHQYFMKHNSECGTKVLTFVANVFYLECPEALKLKRCFVALGGVSCLIDMIHDDGCPSAIAQRIPYVFTTLAYRNEDLSSILRDCDALLSLANLVRTTHDAEVQLQGVKAILEIIRWDSHKSVLVLTEEKDFMDFIQDKALTSIPADTDPFKHIVFQLWERLKPKTMERDASTDNASIENIAMLFQEETATTMLSMERAGSNFLSKLIERAVSAGSIDDMRLRVEAAVLTQYRVLEFGFVENDARLVYTALCRMANEVLRSRDMLDMFGVAPPDGVMDSIAEEERKASKHRERYSKLLKLAPFVSREALNLIFREFHDKDLDVRGSIREFVRLAHLQSLHWNRGLFDFLGILDLKLYNACQQSHRRHQEDLEAIVDLLVTTAHKGDTKAGNPQGAASASSEVPASDASATSGAGSGIGDFKREDEYEKMRREFQTDVKDNEPVVEEGFRYLYHGTTKKSADSILEGIRRNDVQPPCTSWLGRGFYACESWEGAVGAAFTKTYSTLASNERLPLLPKDLPVFSDDRFIPSVVVFKIPEAEFAEMKDGCSIGSGTLASDSERHVCKDLLNWENGELLEVPPESIVGPLNEGRDILIIPDLRPDVIHTLYKSSVRSGLRRMVPLEVLSTPHVIRDPSSVIWYFRNTSPTEACPGFDKLNSGTVDKFKVDLEWKRFTCNPSDDSPRLLMTPRLAISAKDAKGHWVSWLHRHLSHLEEDLAFKAEDILAWWWYHLHPTIRDSVFLTGDRYCPFDPKKRCRLIAHVGIVALNLFPEADKKSLVTTKREDFPDFQDDEILELSSKRLETGRPLQKGDINQFFLQVQTYLLKLPLEMLVRNIQERFSSETVLDKIATLEPPEICKIVTFAKTVLPLLRKPVISSSSVSTEST